ncbi:nuclear factor of activated T-cells 5-like isoform X4 [Macrosteles quadrilineatus]|uniref:nuclear factor of activated T-cells 5-like isoform X4 n=1 Tax=Macrosteles quadrilineatus TaxID=74068 RepID=UPI0023E1F6D1|nr:nuclear factor of activated T-cells 5-like isoform X4 [Macrosteles quadrilineatus]
MLLKYSQAQKRIKTTGIGKPQRTAGGMVRLGSALMPGKIHRRVVKVANKRPGALHRTAAAPVKRERIPVDPCENSNDSGLGFDHHLDYPHQSSLVSHSGIETSWPGEEPPEVKRRRLEIKLESDDANDNFTFQEAVRQQTICVPVRRLGRPAAPLTLSSQLLSTSHNGMVQLLIICQPEQQHRARYQTEGSRGAVKDRTGNGFPVVKLVGYDRPSTLQVFIGTDQGKVAPHMFYQACRVSGKNSTPCVEKKIDGTIVIEVDIEPSKDMVVTCDCVGILKERNVDVEHRFPEEGSGRSKKKSTRCRMVFRTTITHPDGTSETLQVTSQPIVCTQPPGVPEICKKSLSSCGARGGQELFILGKNFLKDTRVVFQEESGSPGWVQAVQPDKEFLQQSHLVCVVPPYHTVDISEPVTVKLVVESSGKASEAHPFLYLPEDMRPGASTVLTQEGNILDSSVSAQGIRTGLFPSPLPVAAPLIMAAESAAPFMTGHNYTGKEEKVHSMMMWNKTADVMMPPPPPGLLPINMRRSSVQMIVPEPLAPEDLKREVPEAVVEVKPLSDVSEHPNTQTSSMETFNRYVSNGALPSIHVGNYLSKLESNSVISEVPKIMIPPPALLKEPMFSGESSNLLTTADQVITNQNAAMAFEANSASASSSMSQSLPNGMSVIVNSALISKKSPDSLISQEVESHKEMSAPNMSGLNIIMSPVKRTPSATERLDAFVNSAADSHISPTPTSPIASSVIDETSRMSVVSEMVMNGTNDMNNMQDSHVTSESQTASRMSPQQEISNMNGTALCSLMGSSGQVSSSPIQTLSNMQNNLEQHINNQNGIQSNMSNLMHSPTQVSPNQLQQYSKMQSPTDQHLSPQSLSTSQISAAEMNSIMSCSNQSLAGFQTPLEHQISPHISVSSSQMNHTEFNNLIQESSQASTTQAQQLTNIQSSLEQQLSSQTMNTTQMTHCDLNNQVNLMQSSTCNSPNQAQVMSNLQASLEQMTNQAAPCRILHSEPIQASNLGINNFSGSLQSSPHTSPNTVGSLSNIQASLEHLSSQGVNTVQNNLEMTGGSITMNNSVTVSQMQAAVNQAQVLSDFQASMQQHLSSQLLESSATELDSSSNTSNRVNSSVEASLESINQAQNMTNIQTNFGQVSPQQHLNSMTAQSMSLSNSLQTSPQHHVAVSQSQVFSDMQTSYNQQLNANLVGSAAISQSSTPLENLTNPIQSTESSNPIIQSSINHISSSLTTSSPNHVESLSGNSLSINDSQIIDLRNSVPLMNTVSNAGSSGSPNILSPQSSHHSPTSALTSPGISMSSTPTMALSPVNMTTSQMIDAGAQNMILTSTQSMLTPELPMNNPPSLMLASGNMQVQDSQNISLQTTALSRFDGVTQSLPVQMSSMTQYEQRDQMVSANKEGERKDSRMFMMPSGQVANQPQTTGQPVKKCEEGMPFPQELTQMSEHDLISYINPSCFDTGN